MNEHWLAQHENQTMLKAMCHQALVETAPYEKPIFDEIYPRYVELAQAGKVNTVQQTSRAFGAIGADSLIAMIIVQILFQVLTELLRTHQTDNLSDLNQKIEQLQIQQLVEEKLQEARQPYDKRQTLNPLISEAALHHIGDEFTPYEQGLRSIKEQVGDNHGDIINYEHQLLTNIASARRYGDDEENRAQRNQIIVQLNRVSLNLTGISFNKYCFEM